MPATSRRWRPRFTLATLLCATLASAGWGVVYLHFDPWNETFRLSGLDAARPLVAFSTDNQRLYFVRREIDGDFFDSYDPQTGRRLSRTPVRNAELRCFAVSPAGPLLLSALENISEYEVAPPLSPEHLTQLETPATLKFSRQSGARLCQCDPCCSRNASSVIGTG